MLSHEEEETLAAMEARLRSESPDLHALFASPTPAAEPVVGADQPMPRPGHRVLRVVAALLAATAATALVTAAAGPSAGGLIGAMALPMAGLYGWSLFACGRHRR